MKRSLLVLLSVGVALALFFFFKSNRSEPCLRLQAKLDLAEEFCSGLAERAAEERCSVLSDNPEVLGQCMRVIVPAAHSSCMSYLNLGRLEKEIHSVCR